MTRDSSQGGLDDEDADTTQLSALLHPTEYKSSGSEEVDDDEKGKSAVAIPWISDMSHSNFLPRRKVVVRERKRNWIFKLTSEDRFDRLIKMCADKLGTGKTVTVFGHLGRETGLKEYNALIKICIKKARATDDESIAVREMSKAFHLFKSMRDLGFQLNEKTYGPLLRYLVDMGLVQEFELFSDFLKAENPSSTSQLGYYEMLLWLRIDDEEMIRDICEYIAVEDSEDTSALRESYLMALCESDRKTQILDVLKNIDITKLSSVEFIANIFESLGRLMLESVVDDLLLDLRARDHDADNISNYIVSYAVSIPNLAVRNFS